MRRVFALRSCGNRERGRDLDGCGKRERFLHSNYICRSRTLSDLRETQTRGKEEISLVLDYMEKKCLRKLSGFLRFIRKYLKVPENTSFKHQMMLSSAWGFSLGVGLGAGFFFLMLLFWKFNLIPPLK